ncbi:MAG: hypothetical protein KU29_12355 [Sulfurovum sp. FS06-10]|nr:MAG: hypothetical protein KU29_12355 [Sulfurovum sp. FS06-10]
MKITVMTDTGTYLSEGSYINQIVAAFVDGNQQQITIDDKKVTLKEVDKSQENEIIVRVSVADKQQDRGMGY